MEVGRGYINLFKLQLANFCVSVLFKKHINQFRLLPYKYNCKFQKPFLYLKHVYSYCKKLKN